MFLRKEEFAEALKERFPQWLKCIGQQKMKLGLVASVLIDFA
jgi:hypothetical protein